MLVVCELDTCIRLGDNKLTDFVRRVKYDVA
jgi:hypothetical protein